jgi:DNA-binding NtrC family response regulator/tetratricopeptide (TPR) repeat protein
MSELLKLAQTSFRSGHYTDALNLALQVPPDAGEGLARCLVAECSQFTGDHKTAVRLAEKAVADRSLSKALRARHFGTIGRIHLDQCRREEAAGAFGQGIRILERTEEFEVLGSLQQLWLISCVGVSNSSLEAEVRHAYRTAIKSQDPCTLAGFHVRLGQLEGQQGAFATALHHLDLAESILDRSDHVSLRGSMCVNRACVLGLSGHFETARKSAEAAALYAEQAGNVRLSLAAGMCVAHCATAMGDVSVAESWMKRGLALTKRLDLFPGSLWESLAAIELLKGNLDGALAHLESYRDPARNPIWTASGDALNLLTEVDIHKRRGDQLNRHRVITTLKEIYTSQKDRHLRVLTTLAEAEYAFDLGKHDQGRQILSAGIADSPDDVAYRSEINRMAARALWREGHPNAAQRRMLRSSTAAYVLGTRLAWTQALHESLSLPLSKDLSAAYGIGDQAKQARARFGHFMTGSSSVWYQKHPALKPRQSRDSLDGFDDAIGILEFAGDAELRGHEALASVAALGVAERAVLLRRSSAGKKVLANIGWSEPVTDDQRSHSDRSTYNVGADVNGSVELVVVPAKGTRAQLALDGIRVLLDAARALEASNHDKQRLGALWQPETIVEEPGAVFSSAQTIELMQTARKVARTSLPVLLVGDTGTGKEVLARAIHRSSARSGKVFLPFNCSAVPRDMVESQLFGYRRGSFTGAAGDFLGIIRSAEGGTLFLDEIGELALDIQPKLLRFLETGEVQPLGEGRPITVDVRVIAATNADLEDLIQRKLFREDLYYRLNIVGFQVPRLTERREEIPTLALHLLRRFETEERKHGIKISDELMEYLFLYRWPGNIRQLANELRRMVALVENHETLTPEHLSPMIKASRRTVPADVGSGPTLAHEAAADPTNLAISLDQPLHDAVDALERALIERAMARAGGGVEEAARLLGISRKGLFLKRRRWQMRQEQARKP